MRCGRGNPTDCGKQGIKRRLLTEAAGLPVSLVIDGANRHDMKFARAPLEAIVIPRPEPTPEQPQNLCLDKGYDDDEVRELAEAFGYTAHSRTRAEEVPAIKREAAAKARRRGGHPSGSVGF